MINQTGLSTGQLNCCAACPARKREKERLINLCITTNQFIKGVLQRTIFISTNRTTCVEFLQKL